jgi:hypothetical protein
MRANIFHPFTSPSDSEADDHGSVSQQWLVFTAVVLLAVVLVLCAANIGIDPSLLWPEPSLIGP